MLRSLDLPWWSFLSIYCGLLYLCSIGLFLVFDSLLPSLTFACSWALYVCHLPWSLPVPVTASASSLPLLFVTSIKLQMDPHSAESSLQKTSPNSDPAAIMHLSTELSAQANHHHHQLNRLTSLTEELLKTLQSLRLTPTEATAAQATTPASHVITPTSLVNPWLAFPEKFDGDPAKCKGFLLQCSLFVNQQPTLCPTDSSRISFVCSQLIGRALDWATAVWREDGSTFPSFPFYFYNASEKFFLTHSASCIRIPVEMTVSGKTVSTHALLDSGAAGNFISSTFINTLITSH